MFDRGLLIVALTLVMSVFATAMTVGTIILFMCAVSAHTYISPNALGFGVTMLVAGGAGLLFVNDTVQL